MSDQPTTYTLELRPRLPGRLARLDELANNLYYSWDRRVRALFHRLDAELWRGCANNPRVFLRRISQAALDDAAEDPDFLEEYHSALAVFDAYRTHRSPRENGTSLDPERDLIAYFCFEYGLHESLPIYSGGLGVLAGDHCKAASDLGAPLVAVGVLYRAGYFVQRIDGEGRQHALHLPVKAEDLPLAPALDAQGQPLRVRVTIAGRDVLLQAWIAAVGNIRLLLLDADVPDNATELRALTHQLYGGGGETRIQQEIILGIGGVRALRAMGLNPSVWHANEGHAAFMVLERIREHVAQGRDFDTALELVAAGSVFTTHTPVPAGHDRFGHELMRRFLDGYLDQLGTAVDNVLALGAEPDAPDSFNMTLLALRTARFANGVSRIHGCIAAEMEQRLWPQIAAHENPIGSITNGVHLPTFIARAWEQIFHDSFRDWRRHMLDTDYWRRIDDIPYHRFVAVRQQLKRELMAELRRRLERQHRRNCTPAAIYSRVVRHLDGGDTLLLGFARRFATYKRATLLLRDRQRLARLLGDPGRPAILLFAGKAHPHDEPGQAMIRELYSASMSPELIGRLIVIEGYDMQLARNLVQGCDVWLNTPEYPMEASGTSGMKAAINGAVNVSVLDGWWPEGWDGENGFAITPVSAHLDAETRAAEEACQLFDILEREVLPSYYGGDGQPYAEAWIRRARAAMRTLIPRFSAQRMFRDYLQRAYGPAAARSARLAADNAAGAAALSAWKRRVRERWAGVSLAAPAGLPEVLDQGQPLHFEAEIALNALAAEDVAVECILGRCGSDGFEPALALKLEPVAMSAGRGRYRLDAEALPGLQQLRLRAYPSHPLLAHPFEMGYMLWA
ncbi:MAG: alpha-glucan family phosphorylase [Gammaproteobacteria bacterium]|nr:alpha-glucan family phosphorylase [Gammaproteobacteria bacterium]